MTEKTNLKNAEIRFHPDPSFHPRRFNFCQEGELVVVTGSANITEPGLRSNPEDGCIMMLAEDSEEVRKARRILESWWNESPRLTNEDVENIERRELGW